MKTIVIIIAALVLLWGIIRAIALASFKMNYKKIWVQDIGKYVKPYNFKYVFLPFVRSKKYPKVLRCLDLLTGYILWGYPVYVIIFFIGRLWNKI